MIFIIQEIIMAQRGVQILVLAIVKIMGEFPVKKNEKFLEII